MRKKVIHTGGTNCYSNLVFERTQYKKPSIRIDIFDEDVECSPSWWTSGLEDGGDGPGTGGEGEDWDEGIW